MNRWFLLKLIARIQELLGPDYAVTTELPAGQSAWLAVPVFAAAKKAGRSVSEVANEVAEKLRLIGNIDVSVTGGFVNVTPTDFGRVLTEASDPTYPTLDVGRGQTVIVEYSSPNIAKPMSIGHLRSTIIGDALLRLYRTLGYQVVGINHLGDWGTQFGKLLVAYQQKFGDLRPRPELGVSDLLELYVGFHKAAYVDTDLSEEARAMFQRLEKGDPEVRQLWESLVELSLAEFQKIYNRLGIVFDEPRLGESFYEDQLASLLDKARRLGVATESDGALVIRIAGQKTPLLIQKKDGTTLYATRDLAAIDYRIRRWSPVKILYVVGNEQTLHFKQVFAAARLLNLVDKKTELVHVKFGLVRLPEGKMSTRVGRVIFLNEVLDEAVRRARKVVEEKNPELPSAVKDQIAEMVGVGAVKYFDLVHDRRHDIVFNWDQMLSLTGNSGPYLQYAFVRATQILAKAGADTTSAVSGLSSAVAPEGLLRGDKSVSQVPEDMIRLIRTLAHFPLAVLRAAQEYTPHTLAQYLNELATQFNQFYEIYPVLKATGSDRQLRLMIVAGVANILRRGLELLGIQAPEKL